PSCNRLNSHKIPAGNSAAGVVSGSRVRHRAAMPAKAKAAPPPAKPQPAKKKRDHVFLVDGSSYIFRAYFAMFKAAQSRGRAFTPSDGLPVGAVMTFCNMLWKLLREGLEGVKPTHIGVVFDYDGESFRNEIYSDYKAHRDEPPEDLLPQFPLM